MAASGLLTAWVPLEALDRGRAEDALAPARAAARFAPEVYSSHLALGRALVAIGALDEGLAELEAAARLAPDVPVRIVAPGEMIDLPAR